jgi:hypothetical protein
MRKLAILIGFLALLMASAWAQNETSVIKFLVIKDYNGKPIRNASVVMHPVKKDGKQSKGGLQLQADAEGKTSFDGVPYGKLRVQVLAPGFQTFGEDNDINQPTIEITVKMKRPQEQYSVYSDHPQAEQKPQAEDNKPQ